VYNLHILQGHANSLNRVPLIPHHDNLVMIHPDVTLPHQLQLVIQNDLSGHLTGSHVKVKSVGLKKVI
jgi:hypothetical protein